MENKLKLKWTESTYGFSFLAKFGLLSLVVELIGSKLPKGSTESTGWQVKLIGSE